MTQQLPSDIYGKKPKTQYLTLRYPPDLHERAKRVAHTIRPATSLNATLVAFIEDGILAAEARLGIGPGSEKAKETTESK